ncbi:MAG: hypothetical protein COB36_07660 [Alphaproteobacteria bacterium]|nr:MAG: hypothetical protein COB36_07660 [Alphaproteobacteria bacterium]
MASFDFIDASSRSYAFIWKERGYLARVAIPVLFVKIACLLCVFVLGLQEQYARQGFILMPSYILEAVFVVGLIRYALYREAIFIWGKVVPVPPTDKKYEPYNGVMSRKQCVQGGIVMYVLLTVIFLGFTAIAYKSTNGGMNVDMLEISAESSETVAAAAPVEGNGLTSLINAAVLFVVIAVFVWVFRLFWLYIPIAMGCSLRGFLNRISGIQSSIFMIATSLICFLPLVVFFMIGMQVFSGIFVEGSAGNILVRSILEGVAGLAIISVQVVAMTYGFVEILSDDKNSK